MMPQYRELKRRYPGLPAAVPARRLLRAVLRGRRAAARACCDHADVAPGRADGRHPPPRRRRLHRAPRPGGPEGRGLRADGGARQGQEAPAPRRRARDHAGHDHRHRLPDGRREQLPPRGASRAGAPLGRRPRRRLDRRVLGGRGAAPGDAVLEAALLRRPAEILLPERARRATGCWRACRRAAPRSRSGEPGVVRAAAAPRADSCAPLRRRRRSRPSASATMTAGLQAAAAALAYLRATRRATRSATWRGSQRLAPGDAMIARRDGGRARSSCSRPRPTADARLARSASLDETRDADGRAAACASGSCGRCSTRRRSRARQDAVARARRGAGGARRPPGRCLAPVGDLERLTSRATLGVGPRARPGRRCAAASAPLAGVRAATRGAAAAPLLAELRRGRRRAARRSATPARTRRWWTSRRSPCTTAASSARAGTTGCATRRAPAREARALDRRRSRSASARGRASPACACASTACSATASRSRTPTPRRCPPTTCAARRWPAPSATSRPS